jgi:pteridine reductase
LPGSLAIRADLGDVPTAADQITAAVQKHLGRLDLLVNNASIYQEGTLASADVQQWRRMSAIHVESPLRLVQQLASVLRQSRGHVINMLDMQVERPWPKYMAYCATKAALWNLTLSWARELAPQVTVNGIAPGVVMWPEGLAQEERQKYLERVPLGRAGDGNDVAELVHFLATTGTYITGQIIRLDGGRSLL